MLIRTAALLIAAGLVLAPAPTLASISQPPEEDRPLTPCEADAVAIFQHATMYTERAKQSDILGVVAENTARACGVMLRGITRLTEKSCPAYLLDDVRRIHQGLDEALDSINERWDLRYTCFVPEFG